MRNDGKLIAMNIDNQQRFEQALASFDALNKLDPNMETVAGRQYAKELLYAERMSAMLMRFAPDASEALQLAARCQHVQRWKIERASYPMTKSGYHQWRNALKAFHADIARRVLADAGYDQNMVERVCALVLKAALLTDAEAQVLEDVVVLVFLESYLEQFVASHSDYDIAKFTDILNKTFRKTSLQGRKAAVELIAIPAGLKPLVEQLLDQLAS